MVNKALFCDSNDIIFYFQTIIISKQLLQFYSYKWSEE